MSQQLDRNKLKTFVFDQVLPGASGATSIIMVIIGHQLGLFKAMDNHGPITAEKLSQLTNTHQRYLQEWLSALAATQWIDYHSDTQEFELTPEQAAVFVDSNNLMNFQGMFGLIEACFKDIDKTIAVFKSGEGLPWENRTKCLFCNIETSMRAQYVNQLISDWLPKLAGVIPKLQAGAKVADIGCGRGLTTLLMAKAFPNSRFYGFDFHADSIEQSTKNASEQNVKNVTFQVASVKDFPGSDYDMICYFDCLHDLGDPVGACLYAKKALHPEGCLMIAEPFANDKLEDNFTDTNAISYAMSTCICTPTSLSQEVGLALGAQAGPKRLQEVTKQAGFGNFKVVHKTVSRLIIQANRV